MEGKKDIQQTPAPFCICLLKDICLRAWLIVPIIIGELDMACM